MHADAMLEKYYACTHVFGFNGPGWLNISAMQHDTKELKEDRVFTPTQYYDVYDPTEFDMQAPVMSRVTFADINRKYINIDRVIVQKISYTEVEYIFDDDSETVRCVGKHGVALRFGPKMVDKLDPAINTGIRYAGWLITKRYVELSMKHEIVGEVGV
jgi:hypothetical protein